MANVLLLILLIVSIILTGLILIQRSEGGALGIGGGGGGGGGFMSGRSAANSVTRMTGILGAVFLICSLLLSIAFDKENQSISVIDDENAVEALTIDVDSGEEAAPLDSLFPGDSTDENVSDVANDVADTETAVSSEDQPETEQETNETPDE